MRFCLIVCTAALIALGTSAAQACPAAKAGGQTAQASAVELSAATAKKKTAKNPAKKKQEKIEYMRSAS
jgi:hypothetical protein